MEFDGILQIHCNCVGISESRRPEPKALLHRLDEVEVLSNEYPDIGHKLKVSVERLMYVFRNS